MPPAMPQSVAPTPFHKRLGQARLNRIHQGKVRDTYALPDESLLLVVATDRVSIFDFVLPTLVPHKGELLTALTVFWLDEVLRDVSHHLIAFGNRVDEYLPSSLHELPETLSASPRRQEALHDSSGMHRAWIPDRFRLEVIPEDATGVWY